MKLRSKIASVFRRRKLDAEMSEEMRLHLARRTEENVAAGMTPEEARYAALRKFGGVEQTKEVAREQRSFLWVEQATQDVGYALRQFARAKGFTAVVVLTLALGIGSITAIYSVVDAIFLHPVPGRDGDRLVQVGQLIQIRNAPSAMEAGLSPPAQLALENQPDVFEAFTWCDSIQLERGGDDFARTAFGNQVPPGFFSFFGARPLLGRTFLAEEAVATAGGSVAADTSIVLSYRWWQSEFAGDPGILGRVIEMSGRKFTVVGVMPEHFRFPDTSYWLPVEPKRPKPPTMSSANVKFVARLKPGVSLEQARAVVGILEGRLLQDYPAGDRSYGDYWRAFQTGTGIGLKFWVRPLAEAIQGGSYVPKIYYQEMRRTLFGFLAAIGFVLAIVCANVANLALARTEQRQHEIAVRAALGAGRGRLIRQLLTENFLLALTGGLAGIVVAGWAIRILAAFNQSAQLRPIEVDGRMLGIALAASVLTGVCFGLVPAWFGGRAQPGGALKQGNTQATAGAVGRNYRRALVVAEVALVVVLLTGAGLMIRSVVKLLRVEPGYNPTHLVSVRFHTNGQAGPRTVEAKNMLRERLRERLAALPGVSAVALFRDTTREEKVEAQGRAEPVVIRDAYAGVGDGDYFRGLRIPLLGGRTFAADDIGENVRTIVVNETLAQLCWPGENAVGKTLRFLDRRDTPTYEVIGVVGNTRSWRLDEDERALYYRPVANSGVAGAPETFFVRTEREPAAMVPAIREVLKTERAAMREPTIRVVRDEFFDGTKNQRMFRNYLVVFAGIGLFLAALGIYGVLAYTVVRRTRELGIRIAIGAGSRQIMAIVIGEGARLVLVGLLTGLLASFWLTRLLQKQFFGVDPYEPTVVLGVSLCLGVVSLVACWLPARRAAKVDPMVALRAE